MSPTNAGHPNIWFPVGDFGGGVKRCSLVGGSVPLEADFEAAKDSRSF